MQYCSIKAVVSVVANNSIPLLVLCKPVGPDPPNRTGCQRVPNIISLIPGFYLPAFFCANSTFMYNEHFIHGVERYLDPALI